MRGKGNKEEWKEGEERWRKKLEEGGGGQERAEEGGRGEGRRRKELREDKEGSGKEWR